MHENDEVEQFGEFSNFLNWSILVITEIQSFLYNGGVLENSKMQEKWWEQKSIVLILVILLNPRSTQLDVLLQSYGENDAWKIAGEILRKIEKCRKYQEIG